MKICVLFLGVVFNLIRIYVKYSLNIPKGTVYYKFFSFIDPYLHILLGLSLFFVLYFIFSKAGVSSIVLWSDRYSFSIYIVHQIFILSPFSSMDATPFILLNWIITIA